MAVHGRTFAFILSNQTHAAGMTIRVETNARVPYLASVLLAVPGKVCDGLPCSASPFRPTALAEMHSDAQNDVLLLVLC